MYAELATRNHNFTPIHIHLEIMTAREAAALVMAAHVICINDFRTALTRWQTECGETLDDQLRNDAADEGINFLDLISDLIGESPQWQFVKPLLRFSSP